MVCCLPRSRCGVERPHTFEQPSLLVSSSSYAWPVSQQNPSGIATALPYTVTILDLGTIATIYLSNAELMQTLVVLLSPYADGITFAKIQTDMITRKRKAVQQTIGDYVFPAIAFLPELYSVLAQLSVATPTFT